MPRVFNETKTCQICGAEFLPSSSNQKYCGKLCSRVAYLARLSKYNAERRKNDALPEVTPVAPDPVPPRRQKPAISLQEAARLANNAHMTYGKYVLTHKI